MSIDQTRVVDAIGVDSSSGDVILTITDHLEWGSDDHLLMLQEKLNTYLDFVESGEILNTLTDAKGRNVLINVICKYPPDERGVGFLNQVAGFIESAGMKFQYQLFNAN